MPDLKAPLIPKNVAWFTVRPNDFSNPAIARQILDAFGEDRGDGVRRLYRFPVVFPADSWRAVMPHELVVWGANEKKFWSEYAPDGRMRYEVYAAGRWGPGWKLNANGRYRALDEIERYRNDPDGLVDKIDTELRASDSRA